MNTEPHKQNSFCISLQNQAQAIGTTIILATTCSNSGTAKINYKQK